MKKKPSPARQSTKPAKAASSKPPASASGFSFPIVGIGASAGGLEALEQFLGHVPAGSGLAFVIGQHLDPTRKGIMAELLQRATKMKVFQVKDRTRVRPDCVYVIPPNKDLSLLHGVLHLLPPTTARGLRLPVDYFFRSLAQDQQEHSIGVILSGMGSDGTLGLRAIKEKAGVVLVQTPTTAKFDGMPRSAIDAGLADIVAPAEELPAKILSYLQRTPLLAGSEVNLEDKTHSAMEKAVLLLRARTGHGGLVITFADISASKATAAKLGVQHASLEKRFATQTASMKKTRQGSRPAGTKTAPASRPATRKRKTR